MALYRIPAIKNFDFAEEVKKYQTVKAKFKSYYVKCAIRSVNVRSSIGANRRSTKR